MATVILLLMKEKTATGAGFTNLRGATEIYILAAVGFSSFYRWGKLNSELSAFPHVSATGILCVVVFAILVF